MKQNWFKDLISAAYKVEPARRKQIVKIGFWVSGSFIALIIGLMVLISHLGIAPDSKWWDIVTQCVLTFGRMVLALPAIWLAAISAFVLYNVFETSSIGHRVVLWDEKDSDEIKAQKTRNAGMIAAAMIAALLNGLITAFLK